METQASDGASRERQENARPRLSVKLLFLLVSCLACCGTIEVVVRAGASVDADGQQHFFVPLLPFTLPSRQTEQAVAAFKKVERPYQVWDERLGWTVNPNAAHSNGMYRSNNIGIRAAHEVSEEASRARLALFGDSFVHGDDVPFEASFAGMLTASRSEEVLNFGVGGYGIDQAFLRYRYHGRAYSPDTVIIGFQPENCRRNLNLVRSLMLRRTGIPFSKPRFILENDQLQLINSPTVPPEQLPSILAHFEDWPLHEHEAYYTPKYYQPSWWYSSRAVALGLSALAEAGRNYREDTQFFEGGEGPELCRVILETFVREASVQSRVALLHIPRLEDFDLLVKGRPLHHQALLDSLKAKHTVVDPAPQLTEAAQQHGVGYLFADRHYGEPANRIVAQAIEAFLDDQL